jgi:hypothetical protein
VVPAMATEDEGKGAGGGSKERGAGDSEQLITRGKSGGEG